VWLIRPQFPRSPFFGFPVADKALLRFTISGSTLPHLLLPYIFNRGSSYGVLSSRDQQSGSAAHLPRGQLGIEFSSPNLTKEFDGGHLRSSLLGQSIASLHRVALGWDVRTHNFIGDWGQHMGLLLASWKRFGSQEQLDADPLRHLLSIFATIEDLRLQEQNGSSNQPQDVEATQNGVHTVLEERDDFFHRLEMEEADALTVWQRLRDACVLEYQNLYAALNVHFDDYSGESGVPLQSITEVETKVKESGYSEDFEGASIIDFKKHGFKTLGKGTLRSASGATSYLLRHTAAALDRHRRAGYDKTVYVASAKQDLHFQQIFKILDLIGENELSSRLQHVSFGKLDGLVPMDGAPGLLLKDITETCQASVLNNLRGQEDTIIQTIGNEPKAEHQRRLTTLNLATQVLSTKRSANQTLQLLDIPNAEEYTGMALQYSLDELRSRLGEDSLNMEDLTGIDLTSIAGVEQYTEAMRMMIQFPGVVQSAIDGLEPAFILEYLFRFTDQLIEVWEIEFSSPEELPDKLSRLYFYECARIVLENGMNMVGLVPLKLQV
jgi:arginyl-tRNA synthetase